MSEAPPVAPSRVDDALATLSTADKVRLLTGETNWRLFALPSVGLRQIVTSDGPAGVRGESWDERDVAVNVPSATALAASFDTDLAERLGRLLAQECRRKGVDVLLAPTVNLHRSPLGGRHFECFSEDPLLTALIGTAYVRGVQSRGVAATVKHYVANDSETDRMTVDVAVTPRALREVYLRPFEHIVARARPWAVMASYNAVGGVTLTENALLEHPLKRDWGFDGVVMSDWTATRSTEAAALAGLDLAMPGPDGPWGEALLAAVEAGRVPLDVIDAKVRRLLRLAERVGALAGEGDGRQTGAGTSGDAARADLPAPDDPSARGLAREAATAGTVLLRNDGVLPLDSSALASVAVLGPNAAQARTQGGGSATVHPPLTVTPLDALREALGPGVAVTHTPGAHPRDVVPPAPRALVTDPVTGEGGVHVYYRDADGALCGEEHRLLGRLGWSDAGLEHGARSVDVWAVLEPPVSGLWRLSAGGLGVHRLEVDAVEVLATAITAPPGHPADFVQFVTPPQQVVEVELDAGRAVRIQLHAEPTVMEGNLAVVELGVEPPRRDDDAELEAAVALAGDADVAVVVVGTTDAVESEGFDRTSLALPGRQDELVTRVAAVNPRTVVVVNSGAPVLLPWRADVSAVLLGWFGGQEAGAALADVLLGVAEPGGRLPTTWPAAEADVPVLSTTPEHGVLTYREGVHVGHRAWAGQAGEGGPAPAYWFGHGLGYTTWSVDDLALVGPTPAAADVAADGVLDLALVVRVRVRNTGVRSGRTVVQAYLSREDTSIDRPVLWFAGFAAVTTAPGESVIAEIPVLSRAFQHWDGPATADGAPSAAGTGGWAVEPGEFTLEVGPSAGERPLRLPLSLG